MFNGLMSAGILSGLDGARGIAGWRWIVSLSNPAHSTAHEREWRLIPVPG